MAILLPKMRPPVSAEGKPLFFLLGPDFGGGDWQSRIYERLCHFSKEKGIDDILVAIPKRYPQDHAMYQRVQSGYSLDFKYQLEWERYYIRAAVQNAARGCLVVWLPEESKTEPRNDDQPYARDTRGELGELRGWLKSEPHLRYVMGAEKAFPGIDVIHRNFLYATGGMFSLDDSIESLARIAVMLAMRSNAERRSK